MARNGIVPLSTTIAWAFTSGSSTTNQRPMPKKITATRTKPPPLMESKRKARERECETTTGLSGVAIGESAHAIPPHHIGQSAAGEGRGARCLHWGAGVNSGASGGNFLDCRSHHLALHRLGKTWRRRNGRRL